MFQFTMPLEHDPSDVRELYEAEMQQMKDHILEERLTFSGAGQALTVQKVANSKHMSNKSKV